MNDHDCAGKDCADKAEARCATLEENAAGDLNTIRMMAAESEILTAALSAKDAELGLMREALKAVQFEDRETDGLTSYCRDLVAAALSPAAEPTGPCRDCVDMTTGKCHERAPVQPAQPVEAGKDLPLNTNKRQEKSKNEK